jgi:spore coat polysaccharide biosynthesis protein SpsF
MHTVAVIQARMGSSRLPGKVLEPLGDTTVLGSGIRRLRRATSLDAVLVATTTSARDDVVAGEAQRHGALVVRGSEDDVLSRYSLAARETRATTVVRVTSDCPLIDPDIVDACVLLLQTPGVAYAANTLVRSFPRGFDVEAFRAAALLEADLEAAASDEREHVTPFIRRHPSRFPAASLESEDPAPEFRVTVDEAPDLECVRAVVAQIGPWASATEIIALLRAQPQIAAINGEVRQKPDPSL